MPVKYETSLDCKLVIFSDGVVDRAEVIAVVNAHGTTTVVVPGLRNAWNVRMCVSNRCRLSCVGTCATGRLRAESGLVSGWAAQCARCNGRVIS